MPICRSYLLAYNSHQLKDIFNVHTLDLVSVAKSFGFTQPPRVSDSSLSHLLPDVVAEEVVFIVEATAELLRKNYVGSFLCKAP